MPQLAKGGKYVFGISVLSREFRMNLPPEAVKEYKMASSPYIILCSGSKTSGGFGCMVPGKVARSPMKGILDKLQFNTKTGLPATPENALFRHKQRIVTWTRLTEGRITLDRELCRILEINAFDKLVAVRGGNLGPSFISRGPLHHLALSYAGLPVF